MSAGLALAVWAAVAQAAAPPRGAEAVLQVGHTLPVEAVALSPDGRLLATGGRDGGLLLWETATGNLLRRVEADRLGVTGAAFSPDGTKVLTSGAGVALLWDCATGKAVRRFGSPGEFLRFAAFTPDGRRVLTGGDGPAVMVWDAATGRKLKAFDAGGSRVAAAALSPDGRRLAAAAGDRVSVWDLEAGTLKWVLEPPEPALSLAFSPKGDALAAGGEEGVVVWSLPSARERRTFRSAAGRGLAWTRDGRQLLTCGGANTARLWDARSGESARAFIGHTDAVRALALGGGKKALLATGSDDHTARLWDPATGRTLRVFGGRERPVLYAAAAAGGARLVTVDPQEARLWDLESGKPLRVSTGDWDGAGQWALSRDGRVLGWVQGPETVHLRLLDKPAGEPAESPWTLLRAHSLAADPAGRFLIGAGRDGVRAWEVPSARAVAERSAPDLRALAVWPSPAGGRLAVLEEDGRVALWDSARGRLAGRFALDGCLRPEAAVSRDAELIALGGTARRAGAGPGRETIAVYSLADGSELKAWDSDLPLRPFAFGPGGQTLTARGDAGVWTWEIATGRKIGAFQLGQGLSLDWPEGFDPAGRFLLADDGGRVVFLSFPGGRELGRLQLTDRGWLASAADGRWDGAGDVLRWTVGLASFPYARFAGEKRTPGLLAGFARGTE